MNFGHLISSWNLLCVKPIQNSLESQYPQSGNPEIAMVCGRYICIADGVYEPT